MPLLKNFSPKGRSDSDQPESNIPDHIHGTPCKSGAESGENQLVTLLDLRFVFINAEGNRSSRSVAVMLDITSTFELSIPARDATASMMRRLA